MDAEQVDRFLSDYGMLLERFPTIDLSALLTRGDTPLLLSARFTAGSGKADLPPMRIAIESWEVVHIQFKGSSLTQMILEAVRDHAITLPSHERWNLLPTAGQWQQNGLTANHDGVFGDRGRYAWLARTGPRIFASTTEHNRFLSALKVGTEAHDVDDLVRLYRFRQRLGADDGSLVRFECEIPLYRCWTKWNGPQVRAAFDIRPPLNPAEITLKWKAGAARGTEALVQSGDLYEASFSCASERFDATVIARGLVLDDWQEERRAELSDFFPEESIGEDDLEEKDDEVDYTPFDTKRQTLNRSAKKQVGPGRPYHIVKRDVHDSIWCLQHKRYKLASVLAGGIVEGVLLSRLSVEADADIESAYRKRFPTKPPKSKPKDLTFEELIAVAGERGKLKSDRLVDSVRDWRNLVHFAVEAKRESADRNAAEIAVRAAIMVLLGKY